MRLFAILTKSRVTKSKWFVGQAVKTSPSHGENRGSIPLRTAGRIQKISESFFSFLHILILMTFSE